jgi:tetratricopeptide (TPR) repeat protein
MLIEIRRRIKSVAAAIRDEDKVKSNAMLGERRYRILVRCDLNGESRKIVARDLGISTRQFSRDRAAARLRVFENLKLQASRSSSVCDADATALAHASMLYELGSAAVAGRQFEQIAATSEATLRSVQAMMALTEIEIDFDRFASAQRILRAARSRIEASDIRDSTAAQVAILLGNARLETERGRASPADERFEALEMHLRGSCPRTAAEAEVFAQAHDALAWRHSERGNLQAALRHLSSAFKALDSEKGLSLILRSRLRHLHALLSYHTGADLPDVARQELFSLLAFAQSSGWLRQSAVLFSALATDLGDTGDAMNYCAAAKALSRKHGSRQLKKLCSLASSATALLNRDFVQARRDLNDWKRPRVSDAFQRVIAMDIDAKISTAERKYSAAISHAEGAFNAARDLSSVRAMGSALRTLAAIEYRRGRFQEARKRIDAAIELIQGHGSPASLQRALMLREQIVPSESAVHQS